jgi:hypothetical protein
VLGVDTGFYKAGWANGVDATSRTLEGHPPLTVQTSPASMPSYMAELSNDPRPPHR